MDLVFRGETREPESVTQSSERPVLERHPEGQLPVPTRRSCMLEVSEPGKATSQRQAKTLLRVERAPATPRMMPGCPAPQDLGVARQHPSVPRPPVGSGGGSPKPNLLHLLLQGVQGVRAGQQLLQAAQLLLPLLAVLLLLLPLLLQRRDLGFVAADGVCRAGRRRGRLSVWAPLWVSRGLPNTNALGGPVERWPWTLLASLHPCPRLRVGTLMTPTGWLKDRR